MREMSDPRKAAPAPAPATDIQAAETQMRRALGLNGPNGSAHGRPVPQQRPEQARARHRFVADGDVPVVVLNRADPDPTAALKSRITELEAALEAERAAHGGTRRNLHETQLAAQALKTRLTHQDLAHTDAVAAERQARERADAALLEANATIKSLLAEQAEAKARRKAPGSAGEKDAEPQPVKWWLPNYKG